ncbi:rhomboid family intramembrane serine protease [Mucilaginibacter ginsenosidivorans]|uniref:Rhomboid family intramembrane serine protease n=1 Tax=Mucilaginibacter ginsenosidivorans TaxID=398053 RepID=A0A5B8UTG3_9SPHI|nr:rhomboid family intramembrane serine protease [Mucilaginibacter ginsenosidivorans]QEC62259.1 rhomboid family intramembrane serine protease [Mucilaginibacter ginsenosidivorans]
MSTLWNELKIKMLHSGSRVSLLIGINLIVFLLINIPAVFETLFWGHQESLIRYYANEYLALPSNFAKLIFRFWTPVTYMFMHAGILHIVFNMLWLFWIGQIFEEYLGTKRTIGLYLLGGLTGASFFLLGFNFIPFFAQQIGDASVPIVGASAAVMAILVATATLLPDYTMVLMLFGPVKLKWLAIAFIILDFLLIAGSNAGGELSHLGGALFGFIYIKQLQRGNDWVGFFTKMFSKKPHLKVAAKNNARSGGNVPRQEDIDRILDKISQSGYDSLTRQEKEILFRASKDNEG